MIIVIFSIYLRVNSIIIWKIHLLRTAMCHQNISVTKKRLKSSLLTNENNIALISPRRLGKTDLPLRHCLDSRKSRSIITLLSSTSMPQALYAILWMFSARLYWMNYVQKGKSVWKYLPECPGLSSLRNNIRHEWAAYVYWRSVWEL